MREMRRRVEGGSPVCAAPTHTVVAPEQALFPLRDIRLIVAKPPVFACVHTSGADWFNASGTGYSSGLYRVLASTNLRLPVQLWTPLATNAFDDDGGFSITNLIDLNKSQLFYRLQLQ